MNITKSKSSITVKIDFSYIKSKMENILNKEVSDNDVKQMMQNLFEYMNKKEETEIYKFIYDFLMKKL